MHNVAGKNSCERILILDLKTQFSRKFIVEFNQRRITNGRGLYLFVEALAQVEIAVFEGNVNN